MPTSANPAVSSVLPASGLSPRNGQVHSTGELEAWLNQGPLALDGARWFGERHWFVATGYDQNGIYTRDTSHDLSPLVAPVRRGRVQWPGRRRPKAAGRPEGPRRVRVGPA